MDYKNLFLMNIDLWLLTLICLIGIVTLERDKIKFKIKCFISKFDFLRAYNSPFIKPSIKIHIGKIRIGTPYFFPRRWVKSKTKPGYQTAIPKRVGFDFVALGWKTKYDDYRFEWAPIWSFVFFGLQIALIFKAPEQDHYWECWLYYRNDTDKSLSTRDRIIQCVTNNPCIWTMTKDGENMVINYYSKILKKKYLDM